MTHTANVQLWIGEEAEFEDGTGKKLFVDGAELGDIEDALDANPEINEVYFGHEFKDSVVESIHRRVKVTLEVDGLHKVPNSLVGRVNVILRVPNWVTSVKTRRDDNIQVVDLEPEMNPTGYWDGRKAYNDDEVFQ